jgi:hypothetical protein
MIEFERGEADVKGEKVDLLLLIKQEPSIDGELIGRIESRIAELNEQLQEMVMEIERIHLPSCRVSRAHHTP